MKRLLTIVLLLVAIVLPQQGWGRDFGNEKLNYEMEGTASFLLA